MNEDWLTERQGPGTLFSLKVKRWIKRSRTKYQLLELAETEEHGLALALDGCFMLTERDEYFYHEMLVHPALLSHPSPRHILVIGGGDGGALREILKHPSVERAFLVEIDREVVETARQHLSSVHAGSLDDERVHIVIAPGEEFVGRKRQAFDIIVVDSTDPVGPGRRLFEPEFYASCRNALREGGLLALQAGTPFYQRGLLPHVVSCLRELFPWVRPYLGFVPTYPSGMWAYVLAGLRDVDKETLQVARRFKERALTTRYYTPYLHPAVFILPRFVEEMLSEL